MPSKIASPSVQIPLVPLTQSAFSPFGHVIANPSKHSGKTALYSSVPANQGSATKYLSVTDLTNYYSLAPSKRPAKPSLAIFTCSPRRLRVTGGQYTQSSAYPKAGEQAFFDVRVLERHPFTSQTFVPLGCGAASDASTRYLVIVAPTLPRPKDRSDDERHPAYPLPEPQPRRNLLSIFSRARPSPYANEVTPSLARADGRSAGPDLPRGAGAPDLSEVRAFIAAGDQAVTYGPGVWHAPMVVLGKEPIDFVVVQYANGVGSEDVHEVELHGDGPDGEGVAVAVSGVGDEILTSGTTALKSRL